MKAFAALSCALLILLGGMRAEALTFNVDPAKVYVCKGEQLRALCV